MNKHPNVFYLTPSTYPDGNYVASEDVASLHKPDFPVACSKGGRDAEDELRTF